MPAFRDLTGQRFGRLVVVEKRDGRRRGNVMWLCRCDCGQTTPIRGCDLRNGHTKSCGCLQKASAAATAAATGRSNATHGHTRWGGESRAYRVWRNMIQRCTNQRADAYARYGGRGITVCKRWRKFESFLADMGEPPPGHQIDRIDNDKGYFKCNCRWVTSKENGRNTRRNRLLTHNGRTQCVAAWAEDTGIKVGTIFQRLNGGWPVERALTEPVGNGKGRGESNE